MARRAFTVWHLSDAGTHNTEVERLLKHGAQHAAPLLILLIAAYALLVGFSYLFGGNVFPPCQPAGKLD